MPLVDVMITGKSGDLHLLDLESVGFEPALDEAHPVVIPSGVDVS